MAKVSVLVPVYNVEKYLGQCLDSIIGQTLKDIEIICVNDGSTDNSLEILREYGRKDRRIKIIDKPNGGLPSARNAGLDAATGEYVAFVDSDDHIRSDMMSVLYKNAKKTNAEIVICGANVFPEEPRADGWIYSVLSPSEKFYEKCNDELLFENPATRPFIWRTFVKKSLIDRNNFRLNESIHIGEDNAFQFRIYPKANGISVIPDKLYNYRWFREDSMMNTVVYKDANKKTLSHIKMVLHIAEEWEKSGDMEKSAFEFLKWSVEFLYDDFIRLPLNHRISESRLLTDAWTSAGYFRYKSELPGYIADVFEYFYFMSEQEDIEQHISIVMSADKDYSTLEKSIVSCLEQSYENFELIITNNCVSDRQYPILQKYLFKDKRIRLLNMPRCHFTEAYNKAIRLCVGEYVHFVRPNMLYVNENSLKSGMVRCIRDNVDVLLFPQLSSESVYGDFGDRVTYCGEPSKYFASASVHCSLIKIENILENDLEFEDYSLESGNVFLAKLCLDADNVGVSEKLFSCSERQYEKDWIPSEDCVKVLKSFAERLRLSVEYGNAVLQKKVFSLLSSDYYTNILVNNTLPYWMPDHERPDGTNSQYEVITEMMNILGLLDPDMLGGDIGGIPILFRRIVDGRHKFIADISSEYTKVY
ncbi:MAG: glycosyltransferase [Ruminococcus sp.]|nr:glycosyltransferase [Ruminococcus sp.]